MKVNNIELTEETILATRQYYIDNAKACIAGAVSKEFTVNDLTKYIEWQNRRINLFANGANDHTLTFLQCALWIQTGDCVPILS